MIQEDTTTKAFLGCSLQYSLFLENEKTELYFQVVNIHLITFYRKLLQKL